MEAILSLYEVMATPAWACFNVGVWVLSLLAVWLLSIRLERRFRKAVAEDVDAVIGAVADDSHRVRVAVAEMVAARDGAEALSLSRYRTMLFLAWMDELQARSRGLPMAGFVHKIPTLVWNDAEIDLGMFLTADELESFRWGLVCADIAGDKRIEEWRNKFVGLGDTVSNAKL